MKIFKSLLLGICCFLLGYAAAQKITLPDLRARFATNEVQPQQQEQPSQTAQQTARERQLLTLRIERAEHEAEREGATSQPESATQERGVQIRAAENEDRITAESSANMSPETEVISVASNPAENSPQNNEHDENTSATQTENADDASLSSRSASCSASQEGAETVQPAETRAESLPKVALVIDDLGFSYEIAQKILSLGLPVTWTIIPEAGQSRRTAALAEAHGQPYLVHIPMQATIDPRGSKEYIIGVDTPEAKIRDYLADLRKKFPSASGVSNHRGSRATSDNETMLRFMKHLSSTGWSFLDSRTIAKTVAPRAARQYNIPVLQNSAFLDGKPDLAAMKNNLARVIRLAQQQGQAVAICHARETTFPLLQYIRENKFPVTFITLDQLF